MFCAVCSAKVTSDRRLMCRCASPAYEAGSIVGRAVVAEVHLTESDALGDIIGFASAEGWTMPDRVRDADGLSGWFVDVDGELRGRWWVTPVYSG